MRRDEATVADLLEASRRVARFVKGLDEAAFREDEKTVSAVLHQLLVVGEAVRRLSPGFRQSHAEIPWKSIAGMRDVLIHAYDTVDLDEVWRTATEELPRLGEVLARMEGNA